MTPPPLPTARHPLRYGTVRCGTVPSIWLLSKCISLSALKAPRLSQGGSVPDSWLPPSFSVTRLLNSEGPAHPSGTVPVNLRNHDQQDR